MFMVGFGGGRSPAPLKAGSTAVYFGIAAGLATYGLEGYRIPSSISTQGIAFQGNVDVIPMLGPGVGIDLSMAANMLSVPEELGTDGTLFLIDAGVGLVLVF